MQIFEPVDFDSYMTGTGWRGKLARAIRDFTTYKAAAEYHVRCVRVGYPACWLAERMWECAKFEIHLGHVAEDPEDSWIRSRPEELLTGLMVEKQPTKLRPGLTQNELMSPHSHWPIFWKNIVQSEEGWSELKALVNAGYEIYLSSHNQGRWCYSMREGFLVCRSADKRERHSMDGLKERLESMNANTRYWAGAFIFSRWKEPGREHILGHDDAVLDWILACIDKLTPLYRLSVPEAFPFSDPPEHLVPIDAFMDDAFWDELRRVGDRDGQRGDKYCSTAHGLLEAIRDTEKESYGLDCGWEPERNAFAAYLKGQLLLRVSSDGSVLVRLEALPEHDRNRAQADFEQRFACQPDDPDLYVMHFARFMLPTDMHDWIKLAGDSILAPRQ